MRTDGQRLLLDCRGGALELTEIQPPGGRPMPAQAWLRGRPDPALTVGMTVSAGRTKIGRIFDLSSVEQAALARYTQDRGQHVHIEVHAAGSLAVP